MLLWAIPGVCPSQGCLRLLVILFSCYLFNRLFCYVFFRFLYFTPKLFCFLCILLFICPRAFSTYLLVTFESLFFRQYFFYLSLQGLSDLSAVLFFVFFLYLYISAHVHFFFSIHNILSCFFFLNIFACCHKLFTGPSSLISHPGFVFLFEFLKETTILSQTNFALAYISPFSFVMLPVRIFVNDFFSFSVSTFTFFKFCFLRDGHVVFFSVMIFFINFTFILSFRVNICVFPVLVVGSWFSVFTV